MANCLQLAEEEEAFNKYQLPTPKTPCKNALNCYHQVMNKFNTLRFMKPVKQSAPYGTGYAWLGYFYGFTE